MESLGLSREDAQDRDEWGGRIRRKPANPGSGFPGKMPAETVCVCVCVCVSVCVCSHHTQSQVPEVFTAKPLGPWDDCIVCLIETKTTQRIQYPISSRSVKCFYSTMH